MNRHAYSLRKEWYIIMKKAMKAIIICVYILFMIAHISKIIKMKLKNTSAKEETAPAHSPDLKKETPVQDSAIKQTSAPVVSEQEAEEATSSALCPSCGTKLHESARFCHNCGIVISSGK